MIMRLPQLDMVFHPIPKPNNMGVVRYVLSLIIIAGHYSVLNGLDFLPGILYIAVGCFFGLSGFLIVNSYHRSVSFSAFIKNRVLRLMPAYLTVVIVPAFLLVFISDVGFTEYFFNSKFWKYLLANIFMLNFAQPTINGVFNHNIIEAVNGSLWTMKVECMLYLLFPFLMFFVKRFRWNLVVTFIIGYFFSVAYRLLFLHLYDVSGQYLYFLLSKQVIGQFTFFSSGVIVYIFYDSIMRYKYLALVLSIVVFVIGRCYYDIIYFTCEPFAIVVSVIVVSMSGDWDVIFGNQPNLSYNMYLVHFPIIQTFIATGLIATVGIFFSFFIVVFAVLLTSFLINRYVETPLVSRIRGGGSVVGL